ncbi:15904_t:CDS:2 [Funneliformis geosporum]|uniref:864_t:CDS:1 n=1 Tax=Funneliformis geosporum TaxID=1117311 RepID=A0A9W4X042_9GLOM|nr:15904_t:CDS:2 [Funneliformis geosporum]CAI2176498.1 864_t:CDS:2 [Funneliformis geosporum]
MENIIVLQNDNMEQQTMPPLTTSTNTTSQASHSSFVSLPTITNSFTNNIVPVTNFFPSTQSPLSLTTLPTSINPTISVLQQVEDTNQHLKEVVVHEGQIMWACKFPKCWTLFKSQNSLNNHIRRYHMQTNQDNTFGNVSVSGANSKRREKSTPMYQCDVTGCVRSFSLSSSLEKHKESHEKQIINLPTIDKAFKCDEIGCTKSFDKFKHLVAHYRKHSKDKTFNCNELGCDKKFFHPDSLARHMFKTHKKMSDGTAIKFKCKYEDCGKEFKSTYHWKKHNMTHPHSNFEDGIVEDEQRSQEIL